MENNAKFVATEILNQLVMGASVFSDLSFVCY